ncbi:MAG TPA: hypothetical protein VFV43_05920 [Limnobacter sp.]|nr:hypothetical protein [Limnobacter sp.]
MNLNPAQINPLLQGLANLAPLHIPAQQAANAAPGQALAQAPLNMAQHLPQAAMQPPAALVGEQNAEPATPPGQQIQAPLQAPGAPRRLRPGVHVFNPAIGAGARRNLNPVFDAIAQLPETPPVTPSGQSTQSRFSPPSVCKPESRFARRPGDFDDSPGSGQQAFRV